MIKNIEELTKRNRALREPLLKIADATLQEIGADKIIRENVKLENGYLIVKGEFFTLNYKRIFVVGFGKAALPMAREMEKILGNRIERGIINSPVPGKLERIKVNVTSHPLPDEHTVTSSKEILNLVKNADGGDMVLVLISGGASSLFEVPKEGITIQEERKIIKRAMNSGINIQELNKLRTSLSRVKGGKFAELIKPAKCVSLILSDVIGPPSVVGSGPTWGNCRNFVLADNKYALKKAKDVADRMGIPARISPITLEGEPKDMAGKIIKDIKPGINLWGGETTIKVEGHGKGGRNQELALYLAEKIQENIGFLCIGTDGVDGPTDAAGGIVDPSTLKRCHQLDINLKEMLKNHNSYEVLNRLGDLIFTEYTGTNLADLCFGFKK